MVMNWLGHTDSEMVRHYRHLKDTGKAPNE